MISSIQDVKFLLVDDRLRKYFVEDFCIEHQHWCGAIIVLYANVIFFVSSRA